MTPTHSLLFHFHRSLGRIAAGALLISCAAVPVDAAINWKDVQFGGFISQGIIKSEGNNFPFEDQDATVDFREMAFNATTTFGPHFRVGAQLFAERLGAYGEDQVRLDWAVADYNVRPEFGVRLGRIKYPKGLYGEALDVDSIRPFIFLPMALYNPILRDFNAAFNGGMVYGSIGAAKAGTFDYKIFYGDIPMGPDQGVADYFNTSGLYQKGAEDLGIDYLAGASVDWSTPVNGLKFHFSYSFLDNLVAAGHFAAAPVLPVSIRIDRVSYATVGSEYLYNSWTFAAEWQHSGGNTFVTAAPVLSQTSKYDLDAAYVSVARRLNEKWELGTYYAIAHNNNPTPGTPRAGREMGDFALSVRYDVSEHVVFKLEGHYVDGYYNMMNTAKTPNPRFEDTTTYFAARTTISF